MDNNIRRNIYIDENLWHEIAQTARIISTKEKSNVSASELIRRGMSEYLKRIKKTG